MSELLNDEASFPLEINWNVWIFIRWRFSLKLNCRYLRYFILMKWILQILSNQCNLIVHTTKPMEKRSNYRLILCILINFYTKNQSKKNSIHFLESVSQIGNPNLNIVDNNEKESNYKHFFVSCAKTLMTPISNQMLINHFCPNCLLFR